MRTRASRIRGRYCFASLLLFFGLLLPLYAAVPLMRISIENTDSHVQTRAVRLFSELLAERLEGRLEVRLYASAVLYRDSEAVKAIAQGKLEMAVPGIWQIDGIVPEAGIFQLPSFYAAEPAAIFRYLESPAGQVIVERIEQQLMAAVPGSWMELGHTHLFTTARPINSYDDIRGLRIRVAGSPANEARIAAMGGLPMIIAWPDLPPSLNQRRIDGLLSSYESIRSAALWSSGVRYAFEDRQYFAMYVPLISERFWNSLEDDIQDVIRRCWEEAAAWQRPAAREAQEAARAELSRQGISITVPSGLQVDSMRRKLLEGEWDLAATLNIPPQLVDGLSQFLRAYDER